VIGGYTDLKNGAAGIGALLVGYHEDSEFKFAGKVGTGFTSESRRELARRLRALKRDKSPFVAVPRPIARVGRWVEPRLVAEIAYAEWTRDGRLRHPSFQGLREDKPAAAISRDKAKPMKDAALRRKPMQASARSPKKPAGKLIVRNVEITHPDKVLYADQGVTKRDVAAYYDAVAEVMMPHIIGRPLTLVRCPAGIAKKCFYQKHPGAGVPDSLGRVQVSQTEGVEEQVFAKNAEGLLALVQLGVLEFHISGALARDIERPNRMVFDLDPDPGVP
jgi:bifunctional non-homologous end joining protein LigD